MVKEGKNLHHCVGSYAKNTLSTELLLLSLFVIRHTEKPLSILLN
ncbi:PcfJ domain-containing protein [Streptococcus sp. FDAARGOS_192]|nr:PcfJ domain-containing protein [Streptococcus sp. FDAARGOS_192]